MEMFAGFLDWKKTHSQPHKLVLIGKPVMPIPGHPDIVSLGFVSETDKWDAMAASPLATDALALRRAFQWSCSRLSALGRPALVNGQCEVLADHCRRSQGGLAFTYWEEAFAAVEACSDSEVAKLGESGRRYVKGELRLE